jgi:hypothetical protein
MRQLPNDISYQRLPQYQYANLLLESDAMSLLCKCFKDGRHLCNFLNLLDPTVNLDMGGTDLSRIT